MSMRKTVAAVAGAAALLAGATACTDADVASRNLSKDADNFKVPRRIVFYNGITDKYILEVRGLCSLGNYDDAGQLSVTCKTPDGYKKHFLGLSDNVTYFAEQLDARGVSTRQYTVVFKPTAIVPAAEIR